MTPGSFVRGVPAMGYRCCPKAASPPASPQCRVCRYLRCLQCGAAESAMRQKFLPYCEPSPHCGLCRYLPCPQCRLVESTIVQASRIADFESPQSRAIQDSAMQSGGARNAELQSPQQSRPSPHWSSCPQRVVAGPKNCRICRYGAGFRVRNESVPPLPADESGLRSV